MKIKPFELYSIHTHERRYIYLKKSNYKCIYILASLNNAHFFFKKKYYWNECA